jgi:site-specific DNA recombinase
MTSLLCFSLVSTVSLRQADIASRAAFTACRALFESPGNGIELKVRGLTSPDLLGISGLLSHLRNRFYIGEVVYRGAVHPGEQEPIVDRALFEAVQARLAVSAANRHVRIRSSPAILAGRIFDDRGNRMTPTHANKKGARYRYYVSHALLQNRRDEAGKVARVPAHEIETTVINAVRDHLAHSGNGEPQPAGGDRELIEQQVQRITIRPQEIEIRLLGESRYHPASEGSGDNAPSLDGPRSPVLTVPWMSASGIAVKGILHSPSARPTITPERREELLSAIAKARSWIEDLVQGRAASFAAIAQREGKGERHIFDFSRHSRFYRRR